jgi:phosphate transport system substrate-binding protein
MSWGPPWRIAFEAQKVRFIRLRKLLGVLLVLGLFLAQGCQDKDGEQSTGDEVEGTIAMSGAWALYPMAVKWAEEFMKVHPKVRIDVAAGGAGKGMADALARIVDIGNVSRDIYPAEVERGVWWISVTKDAVVPTVNENNPVLEDLLHRGVKREVLAGIWITGRIRSWGEVVGRSAEHEISVYTRSDACGAAKTWAKYLGMLQEDLLGVGVYGDPGLAEAVKKDVLGIGFNNINYVYDPKTKRQIDGVIVLPVDLNGNGRLDADEDFYKNRDVIVEAIANGIYPSPPARDLYFVSKGRPERKVVIEFIKWVLTDGQRYVPEAGYISLDEGRLKEGLRKLGM